MDEADIMAIRDARDAYVACNGKSAGYDFQQGAEFMAAHKDAQHKQEMDEAVEIVEELLDIVEAKNRYGFDDEETERANAFLAAHQKERKQ